MKHFVLPTLLTAALVLPIVPVSAGSAESGDDFEVLVTSRVQLLSEDDLLSAGLGLEGLQGQAPGSEDPAEPTAAELRRLAIHNAWNALALLGPAGGLGHGSVFDDLAPVPGQEVSALLRLRGAAQPFRVVVQVPAQPARDPACLLVAPASGSRGVYGAIPLAGPAGLLRGCAVAYTDKGAGTDFYTFDDDHSPDLSGVRVPGSEPPAPFRLKQNGVSASAVAMKHAHSGDHPEADWGRHVLAAAAFGTSQVRSQLDADEEIRVIAVGLSNGGGAALRAAEMDEHGLLHAAVAVMPNITVPGQPPLYDYGTLAALYQPCALADLERAGTKPLGNPGLVAQGQQRCDQLAEAGLLESADADAARTRLLEAGFDEPALQLGASNIALDLWRSVASSYASAYLRTGPHDMPCGYGFEVEAGPARRAAWWATHSGIGPGDGIRLVDALGEDESSALPGLVCLRALWTEDAEEAQRLQAAVAETRASGALSSIPVLVVHGRQDGLVPAAFSSRPYVAAAREQGATTLAYWEIERAQHFDALLNVPGLADQLVPILPYGWAGIEHVLRVLDDLAEIGPDRRFSPQPGLDLLSYSAMGLDELVGDQ